MTLVSNDPILWPVINSFRIYSYFVVASCAVITYDWVMTFAQEVELVWRKRWSLMTLLYLSVRYAAIPYAVFNMLSSLPTVSMKDTVGRTMSLGTSWMYIVVNDMVGVIMIARLHAMYQRSRKMLVFLVVIFLAVSLTCGVITAQDTSYTLGVELVLSGTYACNYFISEGDAQLLTTVFLALYPVWQVFALFLTVWIAVKHFRDLRRSSTGWTIGGWFTVLVQPHAIYAAISCFILSYLSPKISDIYSEQNQIYAGLVQFSTILQMLVLGPRLILDVREYHAELVANSDAGTDMTTIAFQEHVHVSTGGGV